MTRFGSSHNRGYQREATACWLVCQCLMPPSWRWWNRLRLLIYGPETTAGNRTKEQQQQQQQHRRRRRQRQHLAHWQSVVLKYWPRASQVSAIQTMDKQTEQATDQTEQELATARTNLLTNIDKSTKKTRYNFLGVCVKSATLTLSTPRPRWRPSPSLTKFKRVDRPTV